MDFTLSLAHFCELHGPTSVLCTQTLPVSCSACVPSSTPPSPAVVATEDQQSYFVSRVGQRERTSTHGSLGAGTGADCASCRISLPEDAEAERKRSSGRFGTHKDTPPFRTVEEVHVCGLSDSDSDDDFYGEHAILATRVSTTKSTHSCHSHNIEYVSGASPADAEIFSSLRRATLRTLSCEQLPRGTTSGPLLFGDDTAGYTLAWRFQLSDLRARGRQRYYALLALAGTDLQRALEATTVVWTLFEQIATKIVQTAEDVAARSSEDDSPPERSHAAPTSSFLTVRSTDYDDFRRRSMVMQRANGMAELVDNENFFCELHMLFVGILQDLGRALGGMRVKGEEETHASVDKNGQSTRTEEWKDDKKYSFEGDSTDRHTERDLLDSKDQLVPDRACPIPIKHRTELTA